MAERPDPFSPEAILVAGGIISPALAAEAARHVAPEDFESRGLGAVWSALVGMVDSGAKPEEIDVVTLAARMAKGAVMRRRIADFCSGLLDGFPRHASLVNAAQAVRQRATMRLALARMRSIATDLKEQLGAPDGALSDLGERLARLSIDVSARSDGATRRTVYRDLAQDVSRYLDGIAAGGPAGMIPTGIAGLDWRLGGGLRRGQLHALIAVTGAGKTALASQVCDHAEARGHRALMFSMEVDPVDVYVRDVERAAGTSRWTLRARSEDVRQRAQAALVAAQSARLSGPEGKVVYGEPASVEAIRQAILTEQLRGGPVSVVAVDHAQVALPGPSERRGMPRYLEVKSTVDGLRALARNLGVAVLLTAQANPPPKGEKPTMYMVRECRDIVNSAEVVLLIWHEKDQTEDGQVVFTSSHIIADKVRAGQAGKVAVRYRGELFRFEEITEEEDEGWRDRTAAADRRGTR